MSNSAYQRIQKAIERNNLYDFENALDMVSDDIDYIDRYFTKQNGKSLMTTILISKSTGSDAKVQIVQYLLSRGLNLTSEHLEEILNVKQRYDSRIDPEKNEVLISVALDFGIDASKYITHCIRKSYHNCLNTIMKYNKVPIDMNQVVDPKYGLTLFQAFIVDCIKHEAYSIIVSVNHYHNKKILYEAIQKHDKLKYKNSSLRSNLLQFIENGADVNIPITSGWKVLDMSDESNYIKDRGTINTSVCGRNYIGLIHDDVDRTDMGSPNLAVPNEYILSFLFRVVIPEFEPVYFKKDENGNLQQLQIKSSDFENENDDDYDGVSDDDNGYVNTYAISKKKIVKRKAKTSHTNVVSSSTKKEDKNKELEYDVMKKYYQTPLIIQDFIDHGAIIDDNVVISAVYGGHLEAVSTQYFKLIKKNVNECIVAVGAFGSISNLEKLMRLKGHDIEYRSQIKLFSPRQHVNRFHQSYYQQCGGFNVLDMALFHNNMPMISYIMDKYPSMFEDKKNLGGPFQNLCFSIHKSHENYVKTLTNTTNFYSHDVNSKIVENNHFLFANIIQMAFKKKSNGFYPFKYLHFDRKTVEMVTDLLYGHLQTHYLAPDVSMDYLKKCPDFFNRYIYTPESIDFNDKKYPMTDFIKGFVPLPWTNTNDYRVGSGTLYSYTNNTYHGNTYSDKKTSRNNFMTEITEMYKAGLSLSYPVSEGSLFDMLFGKIINQNSVTDANSIVSLYNYETTHTEYINRNRYNRGTAKEYKHKQKDLLLFLIDLCPDIFKYTMSQTIETIKSYIEICQEYINDNSDQIEALHNKQKKNVARQRYLNFNFIKDMNQIIEKYEAYKKKMNNEIKQRINDSSTTSTDVKTNTEIEFNENNKVDEKSKTTKAISQMKNKSVKNSIKSAKVTESTKTTKSKKASVKTNRVIIEQ